MRFVISPLAEVKHFDSRGMIRGALALGGLNAVFGGIDRARGNMTGREYASAVIGNAAVGAAIGYLISPRGWQELPPPRSSASQ